jgi:DNA polymerase elongation subunit (family B)
VWDDIQGHLQLPQSKFKYAYKPQPGGKFISIYGEELTKVYNFDEGDHTLLESDVQPELKVLRDLYSDSDEPSVGHKLGVIDIEVNTEGGFPNFETADKEVTAISLYDDVTKTCYVFVNDKDGKMKNEERDGGHWCPEIKGYTPTDKDKVTLKIRSYDDEDNLLMAFLDKWQECGFTIISGWNADMFDMPYLYIRIKNVLGAKIAKFLSPIGACYINAHRKTLMCGGISIMDYILLYKKFSGRNEPSYALGNIGPKIVGIKKITYDGNLNDLYKNDIEKFIEYNINDVKIVVALDKKLQFIDLARRICHVGHVPYENFHMSSRYLDGAILLFLKRNGGFIAPNKPAKGQEEYEEKEEEDEEGFSGAYVKPPVPGRYHWVFDLDLTSMYPNIIISLNISPETKMGTVGSTVYSQEAEDERLKVVKETADELTISDSDKLTFIERRMKMFDMEFHIKKKISSYSVNLEPKTYDEFNTHLKKNKYALSSNGVMYRVDRPGVIPEILSKWFQERKDMRKKAAECRKAGDMEGYFFNNQRQQVWKILLNSMYGVLGLPIFRFYDVDNAEAVTTTGVTIIKTTAKAINAYYNKELGNTIQKDYVIYTDTDSCFVDAIPIIKKRYPNIDFSNDDEMTKAIMSVTGEVQSYVNKFYDLMAERMFNLTEKRFGDKTHTFDAKQEVISKTSFWLAKKRYAQWIIHKEGALLKEPEMEVKGIDVVRTSFPLAFREVMKKFLEKLLTDVPQKELDDIILSFKEKIPSINVIELAKNTSVKYVSKKGKSYNPEERRPFEIIDGSPAQVKASLAYNDLLIKWGLAEQYEPIYNGQKIKFLYLKQNPFGINGLALKADGTDPKKIMDYINTYVDRNKMYERELKSKLVDFYSVLNWTYPNESIKIAAQFFEF